MRCVQREPPFRRYGAAKRRQQRRFFMPLPRATRTSYDITLPVACSFQNREANQNAAQRADRVSEKIFDFRQPRAAETELFAAAFASSIEAKPPPTHNPARQQAQAGSRNKRSRLRRRAAPDAARFATMRHYVATLLAPLRARYAADAAFAAPF